MAETICLGVPVLLDVLLEELHLPAVPHLEFELVLLRHSLLGPGVDAASSLVAREVLVNEELPEVQEAPGLRLLSHDLLEHRGVVLVGVQAHLGHAAVGAHLAPHVGLVPGERPRVVQGVGAHHQGLAIATHLLQDLLRQVAHHGQEDAQEADADLGGVGARVIVASPPLGGRAAVVIAQVVETGVAGVRHLRGRQLAEQRVSRGHRADHGRGLDRELSTP
eukprot:11228317-Lingulodinium_polyedra.AAC.1